MRKWNEARKKADICTSKGEYSHMKKGLGIIQELPLKHIFLFLFSFSFLLFLSVNDVHAGDTKLGRLATDQHNVHGDLSVSNALTASKINKVIIIDGDTYPQTSAGINAAISALPASGGEIYLPEGVYTLSATIALNANNILLRGAGAATTIDATAVAVGITVTADNIVIADLLVSDAVNDAIYVNGANNVTITRARLLTAAGDGIEINNSTRIQVIDSYIQNNGAYGVNLTASAEYCTIEGNVITANTSGTVANAGAYNTILQFVDGNIRVGTRTSVSSAFRESGDFYVSEDVEIQGDLSIGGDTTIAGVIFSVNGTQITSDLTVAGGLFADDIRAESDPEIKIKSDLSIAGSLTVDGDTLYIDALQNRIGIGTVAPLSTVHISATDAIRIPAGTTAERPSSLVAGQIRYNTQTSQYEGYSGTNWGSLGGVIDIDQDTQIQVEESADEDKIRFDTFGRERMIIDNTGKVGIGTSSPQTILDLTQSANLSAADILHIHNMTGSTALYVTRDARVGIGTISPSEELGVKGDASITGNLTVGGELQIGVGSVSLYVDSSGNVGIQTQNPTSALYVDGDIEGTESLSVSKSLTMRDVIFFTADGLDTTSSRDLYVNSGTLYFDGNPVGAAGSTIWLDAGTYITPQESTDGVQLNDDLTVGGDLTVQGSISLGSGATDSFILASSGLNIAANGVISDANSSVHVNDSFQVSNDMSVGGYLTLAGDLSAGGTLLVDRETGNVGIGTSGPAARLHVARPGTGAAFETSSGAYSSAVIYHSSGGTELIVSGGAAATPGDFQIKTSPTFQGTGTTRMTIKESGNVGIGTMRPDERLSVLGDVSVTGNMTVNGDMTVNGVQVIDGDLTFHGSRTIGTQLETEYIIVNPRGTLYLGTTSSDWVEISKPPVVDSTAYTLVHSRFGIGANPNAWFDLTPSGAARAIMRVRDFEGEPAFSVDQYGNVGIKTLTPSADLAIFGDVSISGSLTVGDPTHISAGFNEYGDLFVQNDVEIGGNLSIGGDTSIAGVIFSTGGTQITGDLTVNDALFVDEIYPQGGNVITMNPKGVATTDFVFGSSQLADTGVDAQDTRMWFDKSKGAFRAGWVQGTEWDDANVGNQSVSFGYNNTASGSYGVATGYNTTASQAYSMAGGSNSVASGWFSLAMVGGGPADAGAHAGGDGAVSIGHGTMALGANSYALGMRTATNTSADYSLVFGRGVNASNPLSVSGSSMAVFADEVGGDFRMGIQTTDPEATLAVAGNVSISGDMSVFGDLTVDGVQVVNGDFTFHGSRTIGTQLETEYIIVNPRGTLYLGTTSSDWVEISKPPVVDSTAYTLVHSRFGIGANPNAWFDLTPSGAARAIMRVRDFEGEPAFSVDQYGNVGIKTLTPSADFAVFGDVSISGSLTVGDPTHISAGFNEYGDLFVQNDVEIGGNLSIGGDTTIAGVIFSTGGTQITSDLTVNGGLFVDEIRPEADSFITITSPVEIGSAVTISGDLTVDGVQVVNGDFTFHGSRTIGTQLETEYIIVNPRGTLYLGTTSSDWVEISKPPVVDSTAYTLVHSRFGIGANPNAWFDLTPSGAARAIMRVRDFEGEPAFSVDQYGNVGINTLTPSADLAIFGDVSISGSLTVGDPTHISAGFNEYGDLFVQNDVEIGGNLSIGGDTTITGSAFIGTIDQVTIYGGSSSTRILLAEDLPFVNDGNTGVGFHTLEGLSSGRWNVALGTFALNAQQDGNSNVAIGTTSLINATSGSDNVALGFSTGGTLATGSNNILIGSNIDVPAGSTNNLLNIGNLIYGDISTGTIGINTLTNSATLAVAGDVSISGSLTVGDPTHVSSGWAGYGDMYVQNDVEVGGDLSIGRSLTAASHIFFQREGDDTPDARDLYVNSGTLYFDGNPVGSAGSTIWLDAGTYITPQEATDGVQLNSDLTVGGQLTVAGVARIYSATSHPIAYIAGAHATAYDPQIRFQTDATPTTKFTVGVDAADDSFKIYSGEGVGGTAEFSMSTSGVVSIANLQIGSQSFATNAGQVTWVDMPVTSAASQGTAESYTAALDGLDMLTIYAESDGAGGIQNRRVELGADTSISGSLTVDGNTFYVDANQNRVGIGTLSPTIGKLVIDTTIGETNGFVLDTHGGNSFRIYGDNTDKIHLTRGGSDLAGMTIDNSGKVGINTVSPDEAFAVRGDVSISGNMTVNGDMTVNGVQVIDGDLTFHGSRTIGTQLETEYIIVNPRGTLYLGTTSSDWVEISKPPVVDNTAYTLVHSRFGIGANPNAWFDLTPSGAARAIMRVRDFEGEPAFSVDQYGNVGIKTLTPSADLAIFGNVSISGSLTVGDPTHISAGFNEYGDLFVQNDAEIGGNLSIGGDTSIAGVIFSTGGTQITSDLTVNGGLFVDEIRPEADSFITITSPVEIGNAVTISGDLTVDGVQVVNGDFTFHGSRTIGTQLETEYIIVNPRGTLYLGTTSSDWVEISKPPVVDNTAYTLVHSRFGIGANPNAWFDLTPSGAARAIMRVRDFEGEPAFSVDQYGNVGIKTLTPSADLAIFGNVSISGSLTIGDPANITAGFNEYGDMYVENDVEIGGMLSVGSSLTVNNLFLADGTQLTGSGEWTDAGNYLIPNDSGEGVHLDGSLTVNGNASISGNLSVGGTVEFGSGATSFYIDDSGNVGIGTDVPGALLEVNGDLSVNDQLTVAGTLQIPNSNAPVLGANGHIGLELDSNTFNIQAGDGTIMPANTDVSIPLIQQKDITVMEPDKVQNISDAVPMFTVDSYNFPNGIVIVAIRVTTNAASTLTIGVEDWTNPTTKNQDIEAGIALGGNAAVTVSGASIDNATVAQGHYVYLNLDTTDVNWVKVTVWYYVVD